MAFPGTSSGTTKIAVALSTGSVAYTMNYVWSFRTEVPYWFSVEFNKNSVLSHFDRTQMLQMQCRLGKMTSPKEEGFSKKNMPSLCT